MIRTVLLASLALIAHGAQPVKWTCTATLNGGERNCCPGTGLCQDSSCVVFGFKNSAKANCHVSGSNPNCPNSYCAWQNTSCPEVDISNNHCYGRVKCMDDNKNPLTTQDCYGYGELCLEDGNSDNFKICAADCKKDHDCPGSDRCIRKGNKGNCVRKPLSPEVGWNLNLKFQKNPLTADKAVAILKERYPALLHVKLFDYDASLILALRKAEVKNLVVGIPNGELSQVAASNTNYVDNIVKGLAGLVNDGIQVTIAIGNEPTLNGNTQYNDLLLPALKAMRAALAKQGYDNIKLTVPFDASILSTSYPPAAGALKSSVASVVTQVAQYLAAEGSPFYVNLYTYFAYVANVNTANPIRIEYALLQEPHRATDGIKYPNMLAAQVAAVRAALVAADSSLTEKKLRIVIGETGWPTAGDVGASATNALTYLTNAMDSGLDMYAFEAFDEGLKSEGSGSGSGVNNAIESHFGWLTEDGTAKYPLVPSEKTTCDSKYPVDGGEFHDVDCPPHVMQGWIDSGDCIPDPNCGEPGVICCKTVPKSALLAKCPKYIKKAL